MKRIELQATVVAVLVATPRMAVFRADCDDARRRRFAARDPVRRPVVGETWRVSGEERRHPVHGPQVAVAEMTPERPRGRLVRALLAGAHFPDVGEGCAARLHRAFGDGLADALTAGDPVPLLAALEPGARSARQVATILAGWPELDREPEALAALDRLGVGPRLAGRILACYGLDGPALLEDDPYRVLAFTDWTATDALAARLGVDAEDPRRLAAACEAALHERLADGDTLVPERRLADAVARLVGPHGTAALAAARGSGAAVDRGGAWQAAGPALMEERVAERIAAGIGRGAARPVEPHDDPELNASQRDAVEASRSERFSLLLGGAGTGKTRTLRSVREAAAADGVRVEGMALSGRAASRLREETGGPARTIAGWLARAEAGSLELLESTLIVVDEASMVDLGSLYRIVRTAPEGCRLLLVGDPGQLPPVGFGLTLHDLVEVDAVPRTVLTEVVRQAAATGIPAFAAAMREGCLADASVHGADPTAGVSVVPCASREAAAIAASLRRRMPGARVVGSVRSPRGNPDGGTDAVNRLLHDAWMHRHSLPEGAVLRGEPVLWTVNDYDLDLWNGSLGRVVDPDGDDGVVVDFDEGRRTIPHELAHHLERAWALTTHKAQGSSFDTVIVPVEESPILDRTLLYTAVTRARKRVVLVGDPDLMRTVVERPPAASRRRTWLRPAVERALQGLAAR